MEVERPWNQSEGVEVQHGSWAGLDDWRRGFQATSAVAAVTNKAADRTQLPMGGYGYLGVCNDSVAQLQVSTAVRS